MTMDLVDKGAKWLAEKRAALLVRPVTYQVHGGAAVPVDATIAKTEFEAVNANGMVERIESRDFIIATELLAADPKRGDRILETEGATQWTYEVLSLPGQSHWRWADGSRTARRVHTKLIHTGPAGA